MQTFYDQVPEIDFRVVAEGFQAERTYYYDAIDYTQASDEAKKDYDNRISEKEALHDYINSQPGFHVREGRVRRSLRKRNREQKAVDVQLAVDALEHAARGNKRRRAVWSMAHRAALKQDRGNVVGERDGLCHLLTTSERFTFGCREESDSRQQCQGRTKLASEPERTQCSVASHLSTILRSLSEIGDSPSGTARGLAIRSGHEHVTIKSPIGLYVTLQLRDPIRTQDIGGLHLWR